MTDCASRVLPLATIMAIWFYRAVGESLGMTKVTVIPTKMMVRN
jgi:hypothetical protein